MEQEAAFSKVGADSLVSRCTSRSSTSLKRSSRPFIATSLVPTTPSSSHEALQSAKALLLHGSSAVLLTTLRGTDAMPPPPEMTLRELPCAEDSQIMRLTCKDGHRAVDATQLRCESVQSTSTNGATCSRGASGSVDGATRALGATTACLSASPAHSSGVELHLKEDDPRRAHRQASRSALAPSSLSTTTSVPTRDASQSPAPAYDFTTTPGSPEAQRPTRATSAASSSSPSPPHTSAGLRQVLLEPSPPVPHVGVTRLPTLLARGTSGSTSPSPRITDNAALPQSLTRGWQHIREVDRRAVELLQHLSYEEVQCIQESVARGEVLEFQKTPSLSLPARGRVAPESQPFVHHHGSTEERKNEGGATERRSRASAALGDVCEMEDDSSAVIWETAPCQLDVATQLCYSQRFYAALVGGEAGGESSDAEGADRNGLAVSTTCSVTANVPRTASSENGQNGTDEPSWVSLQTLPPSSTLFGAASCSRLFSPGKRDATIGTGDDGDEQARAADLSLSPIERVDPSGAPPQRRQMESMAAPQGAPSSQVVQPTYASPSDFEAPYHHSSETLTRQHSSGGTVSQPSFSSCASASLGAQVARTFGTTATGVAAESWSLQDFDIGRRIGRGASGKVFVARERQSKVVVALKVVQDSDAAQQKKGCLTVEKAMRLQAFAARHCPSVVKLYTLFRDAERWCAVLEYAERGDLAHLIAQTPHQRLSETQTQHIVRQLATVLLSLHSERIVHRSLNMHHVLIVDQQQAGYMVKLSGFTAAVRLPAARGGGDRWLGPQNFVDTAETLDYAAPEAIRGEGWSFKSDMWALGVLTYQLIYGYPPFEHVSTMQTKKLICSGAVHYVPHTASLTAVSFMRSLLAVAETVRSSAAAALGHPFLSLRPSDAISGVEVVSSSSSTVLKEGSSSKLFHPTLEKTTLSADPRSVEVTNRSTTASMTPPERGDQSKISSSTTAHVQDKARGSAAASEVTGPVAPTIPLPSWSAIPYVEEGEGGESLSGSASFSPSSSPSIASTLNSTMLGGRRVRQCAARRDAREMTGLSAANSIAAPPLTMSFAELTRGCPNDAPPPQSLSMMSPLAEVGQEEDSAPLPRRQSTSSVKSNGQDSQHSLTPTLSDMSASLLSSTRPPMTLVSATAAHHLTGKDMLEAGDAAPSATGIYQPRYKKQLPYQYQPSPLFLPAAPSPLEGMHEDFGPLLHSVTVSSLTEGTISLSRAECPTEDIVVSDTSSSTSSVQLQASGTTQPPRFADTLLGSTGARDNTSLDDTAALRGSAAVSSQPSTVSPLLFQSSVSASGPASKQQHVDPKFAAKSQKIELRMTTARRIKAALPDCAQRLTFDPLSDEESW